MFIRSWKRIILCILVLAIVFSLTMITLVSAANNMKPNYEVKLLLDSDLVLDSDKCLTTAYQRLFNIRKNPDKIAVLYLDTENLDFNQEGWTNRIRVKEGSDHFELSFKKRIPVENEDIEEALTEANSEGFDAKDDNYEAQIDWGYNKMTLSITNNKTVSNKGYGDLQLPRRSRAIKILKDKIPGKENNWVYKNWGECILNSSEKAGPVCYQKYEGSDGKYNLSVEIWPVSGDNGEEYVTELSFKADTYQEAAQERAYLIYICDENGILLHEDSLKTQKILDSFLK